MPYELILLDDFATWLDEQEEERRIKVFGHLELLQERGPLLGRPYVDTLKGEHKKAWGLCCLSTWIPPFKSLLKLPVKNLGPRLQQQMRAGF